MLHRAQPAPPTPPPGAGSHRRLPGSSVYWAVLKRDRSSSIKPREREALLYAFEEHIPVPLESVHAVFVELVSGEALACAADRGVVDRAWRAGATELWPDTLPDWLEDRSVPVERLNLLHAEFTPRPVQRLRRIATRAALVSVIAAGLIVGLRSQADLGADRREANAALEEATGLKQDAVGLPGLTGPRLDAAFVSAARRAAANENATAGGQKSVLPDTARVVSALGGVPELRVEQLTLAGPTLALVATLPDASRLDSLIDTLDAMEGYAAGTPAVRPARDRIEVQVQLERIDPPIGGAS